MQNLFVLMPFRGDAEAVYEFLTSGTRHTAEEPDTPLDLPHADSWDILVEIAQEMEKIERLDSEIQTLSDSTEESLKRLKAQLNRLKEVS